MCVFQENVLKLLWSWKNLSVGEAMIKRDESSSLVHKNTVSSSENRRGRL